MVNFTSWPLYPRGKIPRYPSNRRLDGLQTQFEHWGGNEKFLPLPEIESRFLSLPARNLVTVQPPKELSRAMEI
jgi:hypothetical protein